MNDNILNNLNTAILSLDHELRLSYINQAAEGLLEISAKQSLGQALTDLIPHTKTLQPVFYDALQSGQPYTQRRTQILLASGTTITVDISISPIAEEEWPRLLVEFSPQDRYLRIDRDSALQEYQQATRLMIRGLAHEIKNPLGGIRGAAQLLQQEFTTGEITEYTHVIIEETDRLTALLDRLLGPRSIPNLTATNIHEILERVRTLIELEADSNLSFERDYDPSIPEINADPEMIMQAILNIARNALQSLAKVDRPTIRLVTRTERQFTIASVRHRIVLRIDIIDNGPGIEESLKEHLFLPMISGRPEGTGLGLSMAHSIICQHRGTLTFDSEPGRTMFTVIIPLGD
ncbi:MAG: PAS domain-containing sensor histidine kinase [Gammaproteobacteria bacterium]|nr:PAS domain-containing sensor histidine kinase [Gammaproteobacteria bacterium]